MSFCQACGAQTPENDTFCGSCGAKLSPTSEPSWTAPNPEGMVYVNKREKAVINFLSPKCPYCRMKGEIVYVGWQKAKVEHGYGVVTRRQVQSVMKTDRQGRRYTEQAVTEKQERAPISQTTYRHHYHCLSCNNSWTKDTMTKEEDFAPPPATVMKENNTVLTREVVKIPCKYCAMLVDPVRDAKCPSCGANLRIMKR